MLAPRREPECGGEFLKTAGEGIRFETATEAAVTSSDDDVEGKG
jgi:hypothetical protein